MVILFQLLLTALVLFSFVMVVVVPVSYASPSAFGGKSKQLILLGSVIWGALVVLVGVFNYFVV